MSNVKSKSGTEWFYTKTVKQHFFHPKNFMDDNLATKYKADGIGQVGSPSCGDVMKVWIKVNPKSQKIKEMRWQTFGCASAIAATSMLSVIVTEKGGMPIAKALKLTPTNITKRLGGLPQIKIHCSVLGDQALRAAIENYLHRQKSL